MADLPARSGDPLAVDEEPKCPPRDDDAGRADLSRMAPVSALVLPALRQAPAWLIGRLICCRHQEHKVFSQRLLADLPSRREGQKMQRSEFPVFVTRSVGVAGWVLPEAFVVDSLGLNDYVVARAPVPSPMFGGMAHSRQAPEGYVEDFRANVTCDVTGLHVVPRSRPLTEADIVRIESKWRKWVRDRTKDD